MTAILCAAAVVGAQLGFHSAQVVAQWRWAMMEGKSCPAEEMAGAIFHSSYSSAQPVDVEPYRPGDSEYAAGQRLLRRVRVSLGARFIDYVVVDAIDLLRLLQLGLSAPVVTDSS
jgi:hypothetical protein